MRMKLVGDYFLIEKKQRSKYYFMMNSELNVLELGIWVYSAPYTFTTPALISPRRFMLSKT